MENKRRKGFNWLFVFDRSSTNCFKTFATFLPLINKNLDTIYAFTLLPNFVSYDDIKNQFYSQIDLSGIPKESVFYEREEYTKNPSLIINEKINFGEILFDFVVFYNNPEKYKIDPKSSDVVNIIKYASCNICFVNAGLYKAKPSSSNENI
jgi:hypothetical protein